MDALAAVHSLGALTSPPVETHHFLCETFGVKPAQHSLQNRVKVGLARMLGTHDVGALLHRCRDSSVAVFCNGANGEPTRRSPEMRDTHTAHFLYQQGNNVYVSALERSFPELERLKHILLRDLGLPHAVAQWEVFASRKGSKTTWHWDQFHVFTFQLTGRKQWDVNHAQDVSHPWYHFSYPMSPVLSGDLADEVSAGPGLWASLHPEIVHKPRATLEHGASTRIVTAGDFMYLPSSYIHQVEALEDSISLTFNVYVPSAADHMSKVLSHMLRMDPKWRRPMHTEEDLVRTVRDNVPALAGSLAGLRVKDTLPSAFLALLARHKPLVVHAWEEVTQRLTGEAPTPARIRRNEFLSLLVVLEPGGAAGKQIRMVVSHHIANLHAHIRVPAALAAVLRWLAVQFGGLLVADITAKAEEVQAGRSALDGDADELVAQLVGLLLEAKFLVNAEDTPTDIERRSSTSTAVEGILRAEPSAGCPEAVTEVMRAKRFF